MYNTCDNMVKTVKITIMNEDDIPNNQCCDNITNMIPQNRYLPDVVQSSMNTMASYNPHVYDHGRFVLTEPSGHNNRKMQCNDINSAFSSVQEDMNCMENNEEMNSLCQQLDSVEMNNDISRASSNELQTFERINEKYVAANIDVSRIYLQDKDGDTLLHTAIILREETLATMFICKTPSYTWLSFMNALFQTPLHLSILTNQPEITRRLIVAGTELEKRDKDGNTALHIACRDGQHRSVEYLLEPVRYHETKQNTYKIPYQPIPQDLSIKNYEGLTCLHLAASNGHLDIVNMLLDKEVDVNLKEGKTGRTILHNACLTDDLNLVKLLLRHRCCNINARAFDESTPFDLARIRGHEDICLVLAAAGAGYGQELTDTE